jgi:hypothetical protein
MPNNHLWKIWSWNTIIAGLFFRGGGVHVTLHRANPNLVPRAFARFRGSGVGSSLWTAQGPWVRGWANTANLYTQRHSKVACALTRENVNVVQHRTSNTCFLTENVWGRAVTFTAYELPFLPNLRHSYRVTVLPEAIFAESIWKTNLLLFIFSGDQCMGYTSCNQVRPVSDGLLFMCRTFFISIA